MESNTIYTLKIPEEAYETLQEIAELATRLGFDRDEVDTIFQNVTTTEPEALEA